MELFSVWAFNICPFATTVLPFPSLSQQTWMAFFFKRIFFAVGTPKPPSPAGPLAFLFAFPSYSHIFRVSLSPRICTLPPSTPAPGLFYPPLSPFFSRGLIKLMSDRLTGNRCYPFPYPRALRPPLRSKTVWASEPFFFLVLPCP